MRNSRLQIHTEKYSSDALMLTLYLEKLHAIFFRTNVQKFEHFYLSAIVVVVGAHRMYWFSVSHFNICIAFIRRTLSALTHFLSLYLSLALANRRYFMARYVFIVIFFGCFVFIRRAAPSRAVKFHFHSLYLLFIYLFFVCCCLKFSLSRCLSFIC